MGSSQKSCATTRSSSKRSSKRHDTTASNLYKRHNSCVDFSFLPQTTNSQKLVKLNAIFERAADKRTGGIREDKLKRMIPAGIDRYSFLARKRKRNSSGSTSSQSHDELRIVSRGPFLAMFAHESMSFLNTLAMNEKVDRERKVQSRRTGSRNNHNSGGKKNHTSNASTGRRDAQLATEEKSGPSTAKKGSSPKSRSQKIKQETPLEAAHENKEVLCQNDPHSNPGGRRARANTAPSESSSIFFSAEEAEGAVSSGTRGSPEKNFASPYDFPQSPPSPLSTGSTTETDGGFENSWALSSVDQLDSSSLTGSSKPDKNSKKNSSTGKRRGSSKESKKNNTQQQKRQSSSRSLGRDGNNSNRNLSLGGDSNSRRSELKDRMSQQQNSCAIQGSYHTLVSADDVDEESEAYENAHKENFLQGYSPNEDVDRSRLGDERSAPQMPLLDGGAVSMRNLSKRSLTRKSGGQGMVDPKENEVLQSLSIGDNRMNQWAVPSHVLEAPQVEERDLSDLRKTLTHPFPPQILASGGVLKDDESRVEVYENNPHTSDIVGSSARQNSEIRDLDGHYLSEMGTSEGSQYFRESTAVFDSSPLAHDSSNADRRFEDEASAWTLSSYSVSSDEGDKGQICGVPSQMSPSIHGHLEAGSASVNGSLGKSPMIFEEGRSMSDDRDRIPSSEQNLLLDDLLVDVDGQQHNCEQIGKSLTKEVLGKEPVAPSGVEKQRRRSLTHANTSRSGKDVADAQECVMFSCVSTFLKKMFPALFTREALAVNATPPLLPQARQRTRRSSGKSTASAPRSRRTRSPSQLGYNQYEQKKATKAAPQLSADQSDLMHAQFPGPVRRATSDSMVKPAGVNNRTRTESKRTRSGPRERRNSGGGGRHSNFDTPFGEQQRSATRRRSGGNSGMGSTPVAGGSGVKFPGSQVVDQNSETQQAVGTSKLGSPFGNLGGRRRSASSGTSSASPTALSNQPAKNGDGRHARSGTIPSRGDPSTAQASSVRGTTNFHQHSSGDANFLKASAVR